METYVPRAYQATVTDFMLEHDRAAAWVDMALGKTVSTLTAIHGVAIDRLDVRKVLVVAPLRVAAYTWPNEIQKWEHLQQLTYSVVCGTESARMAALRSPALIHTVNYENLLWLVRTLKRKYWPYDMVVLDEATRVKNPSSKRWKALAYVNDLIRRMIQLTGTPAPNGLLDIWSQVALLDGGARLEKTFGQYKTRYFKLDARSEYPRHVLRNDAEEKIHAKVADIAISMKAENYLELPEIIPNDIPVVLTGKVREQYEELEREAILEFTEGELVNPANAGALSNKLLQLCQGAVYTTEDKSKFYEFHIKKLEALDSVVAELEGKPLIVGYSFRFDWARIKARYKFAQHPNEIKGDIEAQWNRGEIKLLASHPASIGHGLNMQHGGNHLCYYGHTNNLEDNRQLVRRLQRPGGAERMFVHRIYIKDSIEDNVVMPSMRRKESMQNRLMEYVHSKR